MAKAPATTTISPKKLKNVRPGDKVQVTKTVSRVSLESNQTVTLEFDDATTVNDAAESAIDIVEP